MEILKVSGKVSGTTAIVLAAVVLCTGSAWADYSIKANADTYILSSTPNVTHEGEVNPSVILQNLPAGTAAGLYSFTLPPLGAGERITGVEFSLELNSNNSYWNLDFALLSDNPNFSAISWNSAITAGYITGLDAGDNPALGVNATATGALWSGSESAAQDVHFKDGNVSNGLARLIVDTMADANSVAVDVTLMLFSVGDANSTDVEFYGMENGEGYDFLPDPRLTIFTELEEMAVNVIKANADTFIASNAGDANYEGSVNPSTQLRNDPSVTRAALYSFTLPKLAANEYVAGVELDLAGWVTNDDRTRDWTLLEADFALLKDNPDLTAITWNSALADGYIDGIDPCDYNPIVGPNSIAAGEDWALLVGNEAAVRFPDGDVSDGLGQLIVNAMSPVGPVDITLMIIPKGDSGMIANMFYGEENGETIVWLPHPRLKIAKGLTSIADMAIQANGDTYIASNAGDTNYEGSVNPSTQLRSCDAVTRAAFYSFTLPSVGAKERISGVEFSMYSYGEDLDNTPFTADFALLDSNPDLGAITWNSALADNFITGRDGDMNPVLGASATGAGENWHLVLDVSEPVRFPDGDTSDGLGKLIADAASESGSKDITLMLYTQGRQWAGDPGSNLGMFYGMENGESMTWKPHPRLQIQKELTVTPGVVVEADADTFIQSSSPHGNFESDENPSTQIRNSFSVTRAALYSFTLPQLQPGQSVGAVEFDLMAFSDDGVSWSADFAVLDNNPNLSTITWDSAITDGYISGRDADFNPILGANATAAGERWSGLEAFDSEIASYTDGGAADGLAQLIAGAASTSGPVQITLMLVPTGQEDLVIGLFYGSENNETPDWKPHPRLKLYLTPPGDADGDENVDMNDLAIMSFHWLESVAGGPSEGDFNGSGFVNLADFAILADNYDGGM